MRKKGNPLHKVTIVMYHYVRDMSRTKYPEIKALNSEAFKEQIQYFKKYYSVIRMDELLDAVIKKRELPSNALLLTFDDGYKDHFEFVFPILRNAGLQGSFFVPIAAIRNHEVLNVNKIHFILASVPDKKKILSDIRSVIKIEEGRYSLQPYAYYAKRLSKEESRFDGREVLMIKRLLQRDLPEGFRTFLTDLLFKKYVSDDESSFARELYMSTEELREMKEAGMYIGSHSYHHHWLNTLSKDRQQEEIQRSLTFLQKLGCSRKPFAFCYPYGAYNDSLLKVLKKAGCAVAVTTRVAVADISQDNPFLLPRLDTNDFPKDGKAHPNKWTREAVSV